MKRFLMPPVTALLVFMSIANFSPSFRLVRNAEAIIGMPRTPLSVAGVARRSVYRGAAVATTVAVTSAAAANAAAANTAAAAAAQQAAAGLPVGTMLPSLPPGCSTQIINGVNYFYCGGVYYRAGFQGNSVVYIVSVP